MGNKILKNHVGGCPYSISRLNINKYIYIYIYIYIKCGIGNRKYKQCNRIQSAEIDTHKYSQGFPGGASAKEPAC